VGKSEGNRAFERHRHGFEDNIKMDFQVIVWGDGLN
jgi:hypothetical protein